MISMTEWNAAAALDVLAVYLVGDLLNVLLGPPKEKLWSSDWLQRESGILALGAMAEGLRFLAVVLAFMDVRLT